MKETVICNQCGKLIKRYPSQIKVHNFCSRKCLADFSNKKINPNKYMELRSFEKNSKRMTDMNIKLNPNRMTFSTRAKLSMVKRKESGCESYAKSFGVHLHRKVAERKLGRKLKIGEVVHHIDGDKRNNNPNNLMVFKSQSDHIKYHAKEERG